MRALTLQGQPPVNDAEAFRLWAINCFEEIRLASIPDLSEMAKDYIITGYTESRSLDAATASATEIADFLCTFILDLQNGGSKRTE